MSEWPPELSEILKRSFVVRTSFARKDGSLRTLETTFGWSGGREIVLSGFPGKRDWVVSLSRSPEVVLHTVEFSPGYDIHSWTLYLVHRVACVH